MCTKLTGTFLLFVTSTRSLQKTFITNKLKLCHTTIASGCDWSSNAEQSTIDLIFALVEFPAGKPWTGVWY